MYKILTEIIKIIEPKKKKKREPDLHLMRKLKLIPCVTEICKKIAVCRKNEVKNLAKALGYVIQIYSTFVTIRENRNYMLSTNRVTALTDLLIWCMNRTNLNFFGISFLPSLCSVITTCLKHRVPYEHQHMKELLLDYLACSSIGMKLKLKFEKIANEPVDLTGALTIPQFLARAISFLEGLT